MQKHAFNENVLSVDIAVRNFIWNNEILEKIKIKNEVLDQDPMRYIGVATEFGEDLGVQVQRLAKVTAQVDTVKAAFSLPPIARVQNIKARLGMAFKTFINLKLE